MATSCWTLRTFQDSRADVRDRVMRSSADRMSGMPRLLLSFKQANGAVGGVVKAMIDEWIDARFVEDQPDASIVTGANSHCGKSSVIDAAQTDAIIEEAPRPPRARARSGGTDGAVATAWIARAPPYSRWFDRLPSPASMVKPSTVVTLTVMGG